MALRLSSSVAARSLRRSMASAPVRSVSVRVNPMAEMESKGDLAAATKKQVLEADVAELATRKETNPGAQLNDPPKVTFEKGYKYATLLYRAAYSSDIASNNIFKVYFDLERIAAKAAESKGFRELVTNANRLPNQVMVNQVDTDAALQALNLTEQTKTLLLVMANDSKLHQFEDVAAVYRDLIHSKLNVVTVKVTSAAEMSDAEVDKLATGVRHAYVREGQKLKLEIALDKQLVSGFTVSVNNEDFFDYSALSRLYELEKLVNEVAV